MKYFDLFKIGGIFLLLWCAANTYIDITRYGVGWGMYWWFCNLALAGMGIGLFIKSRGLLTHFLSVACFTQVFYLVDNIYRQFTGDALLGLVDFMYQPAFPMDEFILSHYHYYTIPIGLAALFLLPRGKSQTVKFIVVLNPLVFAVSYFAFPMEKNINCIHKACFSAFSYLQGPNYSVGFWALVFALHLVIGFCLDSLFSDARFSQATRRSVLALFIGVIALATGLAVQDTRYKLSMARMTFEAPTEHNGVRVGFQYSRPFSKSAFLLTYFAENPLSTLQVCQVILKSNHQETVIHKDLSIGGKSKVLMNVDIPFPVRTVTAKLITQCKMAPFDLATYSLQK